MTYVVYVSIYLPCPMTIIHILLPDLNKLLNCNVIYIRIVRNTLQVGLSRAEQSGEVVHSQAQTFFAVGGAGQSGIIHYIVRLLNPQ